MSVGHIAKTITGTIALGATTALGFLPHSDPWFNVLTGVVAGLGAYGVYAVPNKAATPREEAISAAVGAVAQDVAIHLLPPVAQDAPAKTFPAAAVAAVTLPAAEPATPAVTPLYEAPAPAVEPATAPAPAPAASA